MFNAMLLAASGLPEPVGQVVFTTTDAAQYTTNWVVPARVTEIWVVCVGKNTSDTVYSDVRRGTSVLIGTQQGVGGNIDGGFGGTGNTSARTAGGAAGYSGNGGNGNGVGSAGSSGSGGGGGGSGGGNNGSTSSNAGSAGGVGLLGVGANGAGGSAAGFGPGGDGGHGSIPPGVDAYGAGQSRQASSNSLDGSHLRYTKTAIAVTPGENLTIRVKGRGNTAAANICAGAIRIMWGGGRSYPNNAGDLPEVL